MKIRTFEPDAIERLLELFGRIGGVVVQAVNRRHGYVVVEGLDRDAVSEVMLLGAEPVWDEFY